jgi:hypothetical protein
MVAAALARPATVDPRRTRAVGRATRPSHRVHESQVVRLRGRPRATRRPPLRAHSSEVRGPGIRATGRDVTGPSAGGSTGVRRQAKACIVKVNAGPITNPRPIRIRPCAAGRSRVAPPAAFFRTGATAHRETHCADRSMTRRVSKRLRPDRRRRAVARNGPRWTGLTELTTAADAKQKAKSHRAGPTGGRKQGAKPRRRFAANPRSTGVAVAGGFRLTSFHRPISLYLGFVARRDERGCHMPVSKRPTPGGPSVQLPNRYALRDRPRAGRCACSRRCGRATGGRKREDVDGSDEGTGGPSGGGGGARKHAPVQNEPTAGIRPTRRKTLGGHGMWRSRHRGGHAPSGPREATAAAAGRVW